MDRKKQRDDAIVVLYTILAILTFPIWVIFYVMKATK